ncbi:MAG: V-type ATP synthase subunit I, partial [Euryarchaeota archaeon]|nr:V-type ATP synthase subunit I [Euryarchaeota archaeon]
MALTPVPMVHLLVAGSRDRLDGVVEALQRLRVLHLVDYHGGDEGVEMGRPLEGSGALSEKLVFLRSASKSLGLEGVPPGVPPLPAGEVEARLGELLASLEDALKRQEEERRRVEEEARVLDAQAGELEVFASLPLDLSAYRGYESLAVVAGRFPGDPGELGGALEAAGARFEVFTGPNAVALFVERGQEEVARRLLGERGYTEVRPPAGAGRPGDLRGQVVSRLEAARRRLEGLDAEMARLRGEVAHRLLASEEHLRILVERAEAPLRFATTPNSFLVEGWVPVHRLAEAEGALREAGGPGLYLEKMDSDPHHAPAHSPEPPVALRNPRAARPFELLIELFSRPLYRELDPTSVLLFTFSIFFGLMVGDVGYGAAIILIGWYLGHPGNIFQKYFGIGSPEIRTIIVMGGLFSMLFGVFFFGEAFGIHFVPKSPIPASDWQGPFAVVHGEKELFWSGILGRTDLHWGYEVAGARFPLTKLNSQDLAKLLLLSPILGIAHLWLGLAFGFRNERRHEGLRKALLVKGGWMVGFGAMMLLFAVLWTFGLARVIGILLGGFSGQMPGFTYPAVLAWLFLALFLASTLMILLGEAPHLQGIERVGPLFEMPLLIANSLSYLRLAAVGASKAGLAFAANGMLTGTLFYAPPIGLMLHIMIPFLAIIAGFLHSLRLQYYEFFTKFYTGGGSPYAPFGTPRRLTAAPARPPEAP